MKMLSSFCHEILKNVHVAFTHATKECIPHDYNLSHYLLKIYAYSSCTACVKIVRTSAS